MNNIEIDSTEQWKHGGQCNECRRRNYCGAECKAHKDRVTQIFSSYIADKMDAATGGAFSKIMESSPYK